MRIRKGQEKIWFQCGTYIAQTDLLDDQRSCAGSSIHGQPFFPYEQRVKSAAVVP